MSDWSSHSPTQPPPVFTKDANTIVPEVRRLISQSRKVKHDILTRVTPETATFANVILPLAHNQNFVSHQLPILAFYEAVSTDANLRDVSTQAKKLHLNFEIETKTHKDLFELIDAVRKRIESLEPEDQRLLDRYYREYLRNGLGVALEKRNRIKEIQKQIS